MRTEALYLDDIIDAADGIARFIGDIDKETFLGDDLYQSAVLQKLIIIGEAASRLSDCGHPRRRVPQRGLTSWQVPHACCQRRAVIGHHEIRRDQS